MNSDDGDTYPPLEWRIVPVTSFAQNCTILWDRTTGEAVIVDPGGEIDRITAAIADEQLKPTAIWLTHGHIDHVGGAPFLATRFHIPILGPHCDDAFWLDALDLQAREFGFPPTRSFHPDRWLSAADTLTVGTISFTVGHLPGHTPGHLFFHQPDARLLLVGDILFVGSIGRTDFPRGDGRSLLTGIREQLFTLPPDTIFIPGHGPTGMIGEERLSNPFVGSFSG
ncbi:MAG: MBL fold metallo-hydrolase [Hydrogenophilus sp.]|nr:MBL fold metallo-hydrolase [Hydrogenophilus sp.]